MKFINRIKVGGKFLAATLFCGVVGSTVAAPLQFTMSYSYYAGAQAVAYLDSQNIQAGFVQDGADAQASASYFDGFGTYSAAALAAISQAGPVNMNLSGRRETGALVGPRINLDSDVIEDLSITNLTGASQTYRIDFHAPRMNLYLSDGNYSSQASVSGSQFVYERNGSSKFANSGSIETNEYGLSYDGAASIDLTGAEYLEIDEANGFFLTSIASGQSRIFRETLLFRAFATGHESVTAETVSDTWIGPLMRVTQLVSQPPTEVPEPSSLFLMGAGLLGIAASRKRRFTVD